MAMNVPVDIERHAAPAPEGAARPGDEARRLSGASAVRAAFTAPVVVLAGSLMVFQALGLAGLGPWGQWPVPLRWALAAMFLLTASARFGPRAAQLRAMVPPALPHPGLLVGVSGLLEALGAIGLLVPATAPAAAWCLVGLLLALFPANVYAARSGARSGDRPATPLPIRAVQQVLFVACAVLAAL